MSVLPNFFYYFFYKWGEIQVAGQVWELSTGIKVLGYSRLTSSSFSFFDQKKFQFKWIVTWSPSIIQIYLPIKSLVIAVTEFPLCPCGFQRNCHVHVFVAFQYLVILLQN